MAGWLYGWVAGWLGGWVAGWLDGSEARKLGGSERECWWERGQGQGESWRRSATLTRSTILRPRPCTRHPVRSLRKPRLERDVFRPASRDVGRRARWAGPSRLPPMPEDQNIFYQVTSVRLQVICITLSSYTVRLRTMRLFRQICLKVYLASPFQDAVGVVSPQRLGARVPQHRVPALPAGAQQTQS